MGKTTRPLSGPAQKKYFRELFQSTDGVSPEAAATLTSACEREIAQVRVRLPVPERSKKAASGKSAKAQTASAPAGADTAPAFDPFAFSVVVVVTKEGRDGLAQKLSEITSAADLTALAKAQHVALPQGDLSAAELRAAIIEGALQRIANRKAAAS
jgi:hypothetical protein